MITMAEVQRDRYGRPMIIPVGGGKPTPYVRTSKVSKTFDDTFFLTKWLQRKVIEGLVKNPALLTLAGTADGDNRTLDDIAQRSIDVAGGGDAAMIGTALHAITEKVDAGLDVMVPPEYRLDIEAYKRAVAGWTPLISEGFCVCDELGIAGSFDRLWDTPIGLVIGDLKTGKSAATLGAHSAAIQMAIYSRSMLYNVETGERTPLPEGTRTDVGLMLHMPITKGTCSVIELDLDAGWAMAQQYAAIAAFKKSKVATPSTFGPSQVLVRG